MVVMNVMAYCMQAQVWSVKRVSQQSVAECDRLVTLFWKCTAVAAVDSVRDGKTEATAALLAFGGGKHVVA